MLIISFITFCEFYTCIKKLKLFIPPIIHFILQIHPFSSKLALLTLWLFTKSNYNCLFVKDYGAVHWKYSRHHFLKEWFASSQAAINYQYFFSGWVGVRIIFLEFWLAWSCVDLVKLITDGMSQLMH